MEKPIVAPALRPMLVWSVIWILAAIVFGLFIGVYFLNTANASIASQKMLEFFSGYLLEKSLSIDNLFLFFMIFSYFSIPIREQRRVLMYGILGAVILRLIMIAGGVWLVAQFHWILYLFGVFLLVTGVKMFLMTEKKKEIKDSIFLKILNHCFRVTAEFHGNKFYIHQGKKLFITPLFLALVLVELSDIIFALDSIPAIFAVTNDVFIIFTSNIFAILGLRSLYFLLAGMAEKFYYLKYGVAVLIIIVGIKMLIAHWIIIPIGWTLSAIGIILAGSIYLSARKANVH